jgi:uncharacterized protein YbjT (DUF2867 family)
MILVFGATGNVGSAALRDLAGTGAEVRAFCRDPARLGDAIEHVEVVQGDLDRPETIEPAWDGVDKVLLAASGDHLVDNEATVIDQAAQAGVGHVVLLSSEGVTHGVASGPFHKPGEDRLRASDVPWTILRGVEFMTNSLRWRDEIRARGTFSEPTGTGRRAMVDPADIGAVAARVLTSSGHEGRIYTLTGPESLAAADYARAQAAATGREIRHTDISEDDYAQFFLRMGVPPTAVDSVVRFYTLVRSGTFDYVTADVEQILGRPPTTFATWAADHAELFA